MLARHGVGPESFGGFGGFGWVFPLLVVGLLVAVVVMLVFMFRGRSASTAGEDPLRRAARRYANGELDRAEFEQVQRDLAGFPEEPIRAAAMRLALGDITTSEFEQLKERLAAEEGPATGEETDSE